MRREPEIPDIIDDDTLLFEEPPEWLVSDHCANDWRNPDEDDGMRSLASNVVLLSRREWPKAHGPHERRSHAWEEWPDLRPSA